MDRKQADERHCSIADSDIGSAQQTFDEELCSMVGTERALSEELETYPVELPKQCWHGAVESWTRQVTYKALRS